MKKTSHQLLMYYFTSFLAILLQSALAYEGSVFSRVLELEVVTDNADNSPDGNAWGGHQGRIVCTNQGVFTAYTVAGDVPMNKKWKLVHRQAEGWKVIAEGAAGREPVNLLAAPNGTLHLIAWPNGQPTLWSGVPTSGEVSMKEELIPFTTDDYPYASAGIDKDGNIFVLASQLSSPDFFKYSIKDFSTGNWTTYTKELDYRHCYSYMLPDNNGSLFVVSTRDVEWSDLGLVKPEGAFDYAFNAFSLFSTSNYRKLPLERINYIIEQQTSDFPDVLCSAQNDAYLDKSGRVHVLYRRNGQTTNGVEQSRHIIFSKNGTIESDTKLPDTEGGFWRIYQDSAENFYLLDSSGHIYFAGKTGVDLGVAQKLDLNGYEVEYSGFSIAVPRIGNESANFIDAVFPTNSGKRWVYCRISLGEGDLKKISSLSSLNYSNSLKDKNTIENDFLDFSHLKNGDQGSFLAFDNASFTANFSTGLQFVSLTPYSAQGIKFFNRSLPVTKDWQIDVKAHISKFPTQLPNPIYHASVIIGKLDADFSSSSANSLSLGLTRSKKTSITVTNEYFKNTINSGISTNNISDLEAPPILQTAEEDVYLRIKYISSNNSCDLYYSRDALQYELLKSYSLGSIWSLISEDAFYISLNAGSEPFQTLSEYNENSDKNFYLSPGQIYFSDFKISPLVTGTNGGSSGSAGGATSGGGSPSAVEKSKKKGGKSGSAKKAGGSKKKSEAKKSGSQNKKTDGKKSGSKKKTGRKK